MKAKFEEASEKLKESLVSLADKSD